MLSVTKINDFVVQPVPLSGAGDSRPVKGAALFPEIYSNIFLCARKKSGKSTVLYNIVKNCTGRDTKIIAFCSTIHKDDIWVQIKKWCKEKKIDFEGHTSLKENEVDLLDEIVKTYSQPDETEEEKAKKKKPKLLLDDDDEEEVKRPTKYRAPELIIILDDLSTELKSKSLVSLLKKNRHIKSKVIISSQYLLDLLPESRKQLDTVLIFGGMSDEKLETIRKDVDVAIDFEPFKQLYKKATAEQYSFLYVDTREHAFRINFDKQFQLD